MIGQEGKQSGFFRAAQGERPSAQPFLTVGARECAFSTLLQQFVVSGSCPNAEEIGIGAIGGVLKVLTQMPAVEDLVVEFRFETED